MRTTDRIAFSLLFVCILASGAVAQTSGADAATRVVNGYLTVQSALARDSMKNVSTGAQALAEAVRAHEAKSLPAAIAKQAEALANAKSLNKARRAFKPLSESLIAHLRVNDVPPGTYYEFYCPMAKASWLQTGKEAKNPYLGWRAETPTWGWSCAAVLMSKFQGASAPSAPVS